MTTSAPLQPSDWPQMELLSMSSAGDSPVRIYPSPEKARALRASGRASGAITPALFANFDPGSLSWKTSQLSLVEDLGTFSETWPRSGMMRGGIAYRLPPLAPLTAATGSGLLPTPEASNTKATAMRSGGRSPRDFLAPIPTPCASPTNSSPEAFLRRKGQAPDGAVTDLGAWVKLWPTPQHHDAAPGQAKRVGRFGTKHGGRNLNDEAALAEGVPSGALNPTWVEWLMGFPLGWTACMASATRSSRKSRKSSAAPSCAPPTPLTAEPER